MMMAHQRNTGRDNLLDSAKKAAALAGKQVAAGLNRADELGGDLRDYLLERKDSPRLRALGERLAKLGGVRLEDEDAEVVRTREEAFVAAAAAAPPPTAAEIAESEGKKGLGDPEIAAQVYGRKSCAWTGRAITLLNEGKVDFDFIELDDSENGHFEGKLVADTKRDTVPYIYLRGEFVGGYNELNEVVRLGELSYRILGVADREAADVTRKKVEIAKR